MIRWIDCILKLVCWHSNPQQSIPQRPNKHLEPVAIDLLSMRLDRTGPHSVFHEWINPAWFMSYAYLELNMIQNQESFAMHEMPLDHYTSLVNAHSGTDVMKFSCESYIFIYEYIWKICYYIMHVTLFYWTLLCLFSMHIKKCEI